MIAYRLHFEEANMKAVEIIQSGKIGEPRIFNSAFTQQVEAGNIRLRDETGGGTLYDIGIYCLNAARYLFPAEPVEVTAYTASNDEPRFKEVEEMASVMLRFPDDQLATFVCSFGAASNSRTASKIRRWHSSLFRSGGSAASIACRTRRRFTPNFSAAPMMVPQPSSYSCLIRSNNSTFCLRSVSPALLSTKC